MAQLNRALLFNAFHCVAVHSIHAYANFLSLIISGLEGSINPPRRGSLRRKLGLSPHSITACHIDSTFTATVCRFYCYFSARGDEEGMNRRWRSHRKRFRACKQPWNSIRYGRKLLASAGQSHHRLDWFQFFATFAKRTHCQFGWN